MKALTCTYQGKSQTEFLTASGTSSIFAFSTLFLGLVFELEVLGIVVDEETVDEGSGLGIDMFVLVELFRIMVEAIEVAPLTETALFDEF